MWTDTRLDAVLSLRRKENETSKLCQKFFRLGKDWSYKLERKFYLEQWTLMIEKPKPRRYTEIVEPRVLQCCIEKVHIKQQGHKQRKLEKSPTIYNIVWNHIQLQLHDNNVNELL